MQLGDGSEGWQLTVSHQPFVTAAVEAEPEPARVERVIHPPMPGSHDVVADELQAATREREQALAELAAAERERLTAEQERYLASWQEGT